MHVWPEQQLCNTTEVLQLIASVFVSKDAASLISCGAADELQLS